MTTHRDPKVIKDEIAAAKETFDHNVFDGEFYDRYSRMSLRHQWARLQEQIAPLVDELNTSNEYHRIIEQERERNLYLIMRKRHGRTAA